MRVAGWRRLQTLLASPSAVAALAKRERLEQLLAEARPIMWMEGEESYGSRRVATRAVALARLEGGKMNEREAIIRRNPDGSVDDVVIGCDWLRLERMDTDCWWLSAERGDGTHTMFFLARRGKRVQARDYEDTIGCVDDGKTTEEREAKAVAPVADAG